MFRAIDNIQGSNNYSTDEQVIGTLIDGRPIYQIVIDLNSAVLPGSSSQVNISASLSALNIDMLISSTCIITGINNYEGTKFSTDSARGWICIKTDSDSNNIQVGQTQTGGGNSFVAEYAILKYVKVSS